VQLPIPLDLPSMPYLCLLQKRLQDHEFAWTKSFLMFKNSSKGNQNLSRYYNSITNLKFQQQPKYHLSKILI
jgi:hypothetical protein